MLKALSAAELLHSCLLIEPKTKALHDDAVSTVGFTENELHPSSQQSKPIVVHQRKYQPKKEI